MLILPNMPPKAAGSSSVLTAGIASAVYSTTGSKSLDPSGWAGITPTGAILLGNVTTAVATIGADAGAGIGFFDGTNARLMFSSSDDASGTMNAAQRQYDDGTIMYTASDDAKVASIQGAATAASFASGGLDFTYTHTTGQSHIAALLLEGVSIQVGTISPSTSASGTASISGMSFQPVAFIFFHPKDGRGFNETDDNGNVFGIGVCDSALNQGCALYAEDDGVGTTVSTMRWSDSHVGFNFNDNGTLEASFQVSAIASDGFTITTDTVIGGNSATDVGYIAIGGAGLNSFVGSHLPSGSSGSVTGATFTPVAMLSIACFSTAGDSTNDTNGNAAGYSGISVGMSCNNGGIEQWCISNLSEDNVATTVTKQEANSDRIYSSPTSAAAWEGIAVSSFNSNGFSWTSAEADPDGDEKVFHLMLG